MPQLPFSAQYTAVAAFLAAIVLWATKKFIAEGIKHAGQRFWPVLVQPHRSNLRRRELSWYRQQVAKGYNMHALGFLRNSPVRVSDVYVPLQHEEESGSRADIYENIRSNRRTVILGAAGAGKSMLLKNSMVKWATGTHDHQRVPVLVELFRCNNEMGSLTDLVLDAFRRNRVKRPEGFLPKALDAGMLSVFFDGLDEVVTDRRHIVVDQVTRFAEEFPDCQVVVTCRDAVYEGDLRPVFDHEVHISGFDDAAIYRFLRLWLARNSAGQDVRHEVEQLMAALRASPALLRLARNPLLITMIASLYDADPGIGPVLSNSRTEFYEMAVTHLLRRDRDLGRHGAIAAYRAGHKMMALRTIALAAQGATPAGADSRAISEQELIDLITKVLTRFNIEAPHAPKVLDEIVSRSGLLVRVDEGNLLYEFPHLTLQEYMAAMELADDPDRLIALYRENPFRWRETVKLWCGGANRDCTRIVLDIFASSERDKLLALECLAEARQIDERTAEAILRHFEATLHRTGPEQRHVVAALGAVAADPGPRGTSLLARLRTAAASADDAVRSGAVQALAASRLRAAIETIGDLSASSPTARLALRTMGDQAVPMLTQRAKSGSVEAVDDIGAIGTPSAGIALAELVWREDDVAIRAAWRLAGLIDSPELEEELREMEAPAFMGRSYYDWLWVPFSRDDDRHVIAIIGRVGFLIDICGPGDVPSAADSVDPRIALPLAVRGIVQSQQPSPLDESLIERRIQSAYDGDRLDQAVGAGGSHLSQDLSRLRRKPRSVPDRLRALGSVDPALARTLSDEFLRCRGVPGKNRIFLRALPATVVAEIAASAWESKLRVSERDWRRVADDVLAPDRQVRILLALGGLVAAALLLTGVSQILAPLTGHRPVAPPWLGTLALIALATAMVASSLLGISLKVMPATRRPHAALRELAAGQVPTVVGAVLVTVAGVALATSGIMAMGRWIGPTNLLLVTAPVLATVGALWIWIRRRHRAFDNPYRRLLELDEKMMRSRATVIAPRPRVSPDAGGLTRAPLAHKGD